MATKRPGFEPGGSEFSHGKGLMPPPHRGYEPMEYEQLHAQFRVDPDDPTAQANYDGIGDRFDKPTTPPVRETGPAQ